MITVLVCVLVTIEGDPPGEENSHMNFRIETIEDTDLEVVQASFETMSEKRQIYFFLNFTSRATLNETFTASWRFPQNTLSETKIRNLTKFVPLNVTTSIPALFIREPTPPRGKDDCR